MSRQVARAFETSMSKKNRKRAAALVLARKAELAPADEVVSTDILALPNDLDETLNYLLRASERSTGQLFLNAEADAANARKSAQEAEDLAIQEAARSLAIQMVRRWLARQPKLIGGSNAAKSEPARVIRVAVPVDSEVFNDPMRPFFEGSGGWRARAIVEALPDRRNQWAKYFTLYGCFYCRERSRPHVANGLCSRCHPQITTKLKRIQSMSDEEIESTGAQCVAAEEPKPQTLKVFTCDVCGFRSKPMKEKMWIGLGKKRHEEGWQHQKALTGGQQ